MTNVTPLRRKKEPTRRPWQMVESDPTAVTAALKKIDKEEKEALDALTAPELKTYLAELANHEEASIAAKARDPDIKKAAEIINELRRPYNEAVAGARARRTYVCFLIDAYA